jgi:microsomal epoxide hydrolase
MTSIDNDLHTHVTQNMAWPSSDLKVEHFAVRVPESALSDLQDALRYSKIGPSTFENSSKAGPGYGLSRDWLIEAKEHWVHHYDWYA